MALDWELAMNNKTRAFTLLEILIILLIISLLAVIILPQLSKADNEDKLTEMVSILQNVRSHIQLYRIQHFGLLPGQDTFDGCISENDFIYSITLPKPNTYDPYLPEIPMNPFNLQNSVTCVNDPNLLPDGTEGTGWWFNAATGEFRACDSPFHAAY